MRTIDYVVLVGTLIAYGVVSYLIVQFARKKISKDSYYKRIISLSLVYSLLFGLTICGSGNYNGFAFPATNLVTIILYLIYLETHIFLLITILFWWLFFFIMMRLNVKKW